MTQVILRGRGHRIHTGKMPKTKYALLEEESESSDDGSIDIWDYIDFNIAYGADPERFELVIDNQIVTADLAEVGAQFKCIAYPHEELPRRTDKNQNIVLIEYERGKWCEQEIENFRPDLLHFELRTFTVPTGSAFQVLTAHYNGEAFEAPLDLNPKGVTHFFV
jgi:hypothetical protein